MSQNQGTELVVAKVNISALPPDDDRWQWGLHPTLRRVLDNYCIKWSVDEPGMMDVLLRQPQ